VVRDGNFIGAVGPDQNAAQQAINAMRATWNAPAQPCLTICARMWIPARRASATRSAR
jgi:hypothetical protein